MTSRIYKLDNLKFIAMTGVLVSHALAATPWWSVLRPFTVVDILGPSMFVFSFISGWLIRRERVSYLKELRFLVLVLFFNFIVNIFDIYISCNEHRAILSAARTYWYFYVLILCRIGFPIIGRPGWVLAFACAVSWLSFAYPTWCNTNPIARFIGFVPFVAAGYFVAHSPTANGIKSFLIDDKGCRKYQIACCLLLIGAIGVSVSQYAGVATDTIANNHAFIACSWRRAVLRVMCHVVLLLWVFCWFKAVPNRELIFTRFGRRTLAVYLLHMLPLFVCMGLIKRYEMSGLSIVLLIVCGAGVMASLFNSSVSNVFSRILKGRSRQ